jgi:hypothetical protein
MTRFVWTCAAVWCGLATGCGDSKPQVSANPNKDALVELGEMLKLLADEKRKPPGRLAELEPVEPYLPSAAPLLRDGTLVYVWGAAHMADGTAVVAYEKAAPTEGGAVLLQNGQVKKLSATEFAAAPKAGGKK